MKATQIFLTLFVFAVLSANDAAPVAQAQRRCTATEAQLNISSEPSGALVFIDPHFSDPHGVNLLLGPTPLTHVCTAMGTHTLVFRMEGYADAQLEIVVLAGDPLVTHTATLTQSSPSTRTRSRTSARSGTPSECSTLASTPDYPTTRIGPVIAALQQASLALGDVIAHCHPSTDPLVYSYYDESCRASVGRCQAQMASALAMEDPEDRGYEVRVLHVISNLLSQPVGGQHFAVPPEWNTHQMHGITGGDYCDPAVHYDAVVERHDEFSVDANFYRQVERTYQQWWDWVRGLCHMTR